MDILTIIGIILGIILAMPGAVLSILDLWKATSIYRRRRRRRKQR